MPPTAKRRRSDVAPIVEEGLRELASDFAKHGPDYAERYLSYLLGERATPPSPGGQFHPKIAAAVRDIVVDQAYLAGVRSARIR